MQKNCNFHDQIVIFGYQVQNWFWNVHSGDTSSRDEPRPDSFKGVCVIKSDQK